MKREKMKVLFHLWEDKVNLKICADFLPHQIKKRKFCLAQKLVTADGTYATQSAFVSTSNHQSSLKKEMVIIH